MTVLRVTVSVVCLAAVTVLTACTADPGSVPVGPTAGASSMLPSAAPSTTTSAVQTPSPTGGSGATAVATPSSAPSPSAAPTTSDQPVPKVERSGVPRATISAKPARVDGTVEYADGVSLRVLSVDFDEETREGPGSFPGRKYAVLKLRIANSSTKDLSMETVVVTVLDKVGQPVALVSVDEAKVSDFAGRLRAGATATARYAFAVPRSSRSQVTVVVDFDGAHTSAVFRGKLS